MSAALAKTAIALGLPVFSCSWKKTPAWSKKQGGCGHLDATTDPDKIRRLFDHRHAKLIGVATGPLSGIDALDLDYRNGAGAWEEANAHRLPETRVHQSQSGGRHLLFRHAPGVRNTASVIAPGVDVRGDGGYLIWPPSTGYTVISDAEPVDWPDWLLAEILPKTQPAPPRAPSAPRQPVSAERIERIVSRALDKVRAAGEGQKHFTLRNQALLFGGIQHLAGYSDSQAIRWLVDALPATVKDRRAAEKTAAWGIENGKLNPIDLHDECLPQVSRLDDPPAPANSDERMDGVLDRVEALRSPLRSDPDALVLSPGAPMDSARVYIEREHMLGDLRTLHHQNAGFYTWQQTHYAEEPMEEIRAGLYRFLDTAQRFDSEKQQLVPFNPNKSRVANTQEALAAVAQLGSEIRPPAWLNAADGPNPAEVIACSNGLLHLPTMTLQPLTPAFFTLNALDFPYQPDAAQPVEWTRFLASLWPNDQESIDALQEIFGLVLTSETHYQKAFLIVGPKRSGKGTVGRILTRLIGPANVCGPTLSSLGTNFGISPLIGKRLAIISDARLSGKADQSIITERLLSVTGEDGQSVDRKFRDAWFGKLDARFLIMTNELPKLTDSSGALAGRFVILRMTESFFGREDLGLGARLSLEMPGILLWAITGWHRLTKRGHFITPASSKAAQEYLENLASPVGAFIREQCELGQGNSVECGALYNVWCAWCQEQGRDHPGTSQSFGRDLAAAAAGVESRQRMEDGVRFRVYEGIRIKDRASPTDRQTSDEAAITRDYTRETPSRPYFQGDPGYTL